MRLLKLLILISSILLYGCTTITDERNDTYLAFCLVLQAGQQFRLVERTKELPEEDKDEDDES